MTDKISRYLVLRLLGISMIVLLMQPLGAAEKTSPKEVYTGTVVAIGGVSGPSRMVSGTFNLTITDYTSDEDAQRFLITLAEEKQDGLLKAMRKENKGSFAIGGQVGRQVNIVRATEVDGKRRLVVAFERWLKMAEVRAGARSQDYPIGIVELFVGPDGTGEGTYIGAAKVSWKVDEKTAKKTVEIENFGTYPARLIGVTRHNTK